MFSTTNSADGTPYKVTKSNIFFFKTTVIRGVSPLTITAQSYEWQLPGNCIIHERLVPLNVSFFVCVFTLSGIPGKKCGVIIFTAEELSNCRVSTHTHKLTRKSLSLLAVYLCCNSVRLPNTSLFWLLWTLRLFFPTTNKCKIEGPITLCLEEKDLICCSI